MPGSQGHFLTMPQRQRGVVIVVMMTIIILASTMLLVSRLNNTSWQHQNVTQTARALAEAKQALIGFAIRSQTRPGELPCPDVNNDGVDDYAANLCVSLTGRLPWRTLGLNDPRDGSGERLWYAVSNNLHANDIPPINSNTPGQLIVDTLPGFAAIVMASHAVLTGQVRNAANLNNPGAYLEDDNATVGDNSFTRQGGQPFNDRLLAITQQDLMIIVERRVANEMRNQLQSYYTLNGFFPYAASLSDNPNYYCDNMLRSGHLPLAIGTGFIPGSGLDCTGIPNWSAPMPAWFINNNWIEVIYYALAAPCVPGTALCDGAGNMITVNNLSIPNNNKAAVVISAGTAFVGQVRPPVIAADLLDSLENNNGDNLYERLPITASNNDQFAVIEP